VGKGHQRGGHGNGFDVPDVQADASEWRKTMVHLLRHQIVLLAMKQRRAPLPVSPALWKGLVRLRALNDLYDLGSIARRLSFLGGPLYFAYRIEGTGWDEITCGGA
jgi:hypothetical protein